MAFKASKIVQILISLLFEPPPNSLVSVCCLNLASNRPEFN